MPQHRREHALHGQLLLAEGLPGAVPLALGAAHDPDAVLAATVAPAVEPAVEALDLEPGPLEQRAPLLGLGPRERHRRPAAVAGDGQDEPAPLDVPVGALPDPGLSLEPARVRLGDVLGARAEDVEHVPAARDEQPARGAERPEALFVVL